MYISTSLFNLNSYVVYFTRMHKICLYMRACDDVWIYDPSLLFNDCKREFNDFEIDDESHIKKNKSMINEKKKRKCCDK